MLIKVGRGRFTRKIATIPMNDKITSRIIEGRTGRLGKTYQGVTTRGIKASTSSPHDLPRVNSLINDNQCITLLQERLLTGSSSVQEQTINFSNVNCHVANLAHTAPGHSQKKELSPGVADCYLVQEKLKYVKGASCVTQLPCVKPVTNAPSVVTNLPVGARLQNFWKTWLDLGAGPKVVQILREGYTLPFGSCQNSQGLLLSISCYVNPHRNSYRPECNRTSKKQNLSELFQPTFFSPQAKPKMETYSRSEQSEFFPQGGEIQDGDTRNHQDIPPARGVGHLNRFQGRLLPHTNTGTVQEISEISCPGSDIPVQGPALWSVHSTLAVYCDSKGGETDGQSQGYKNPPVPRRLVGESHIPPGLSPAYSESGENMSKIGLAGEFGKVRTGPKAGLRFCRLPVRPQARLGPTDPRQVAEPSGQNIRNNVTATLSGSTVHVPDRVANSHRKASSPRPATHETHTVAPQTTLENTRITRKSHSNSQILVPSFTMVATGRQCSHRPTITPNKACSANLYRRIKRRLT